MRQVIGYVEYGQSQVAFSSPVRTINDAVFQDVVFNGILIKRIIAGMRQVPLYLVRKTAIVIYRKFY